MKTIIATVALLILAAGLAAATPVAKFDPGVAPFSLEVDNEAIPYRVFGIYVMPGQVVNIHLHDPRADILPGDAVLTAQSGTVRRQSREKWTWRAPSTTGLTRVVARTAAGSVQLNAFVMVPATRVAKGSLEGYRIGTYPGKPLRGLAIYRPPVGFVEVTPANRDTLIAPHFTIGQFLCKEAGGYPKFVALRERLVLKLEYLLQLVNDRGYHADTFYVMSGFRTPAYNTALGNVRYSRHQWGDAADIFIDESPKDGRMDDLNGDGRSDVRDAIALYDLIDSQFSVPEYEVYQGGLGNYGPTHTHGPFVHVDARGFKARWGR